MDKKEVDKELSAKEIMRLKSIDLDRKSDEAIELKNVLEAGEKRLDIYSAVLEVSYGTFKFITSLKLELITLLYMTSYIMRSTTAVAILMDKVCKVHLKYSDEICANLGNKIYESQKTEVEKMANNYHVGHTMIGLVPSSLLACFIGPWSDKYGRRFPILVSLVGGLIDDMLSTIWAYFPQARAEFYFIPPVFTGLSGGFIATLTILYSYASDITRAKKRTLKYALLEGALGFAIPIGSFMGGFLYKRLGSMPVFGVCFLGHLLDLLFVIFFLKETTGIGNTDNWNKKIRLFFSSKNFLEGFRAAVKNRLHRGKLQLWLLFLAMGIGILVQAGSGNITFLFVHHHYNWDNEKFSNVSAVFSVMTLVIMIIAVPIFTKILRLSDPMLGLIGSASLLGKSVCLAIAGHQGLFFLGYLLGLLSVLPGLAGRARISKIIPKSDLGKVFAFLSTVESLIPIGGTSLVSQLFNATLGIIPDPSFSLFSALIAVMLGVFIWLYFLPKINYEEMREQEEVDEEKAVADKNETLETSN